MNSLRITQKLKKEKEVFQVGIILEVFFSLPHSFENVKDLRSWKMMWLQDTFRELTQKLSRSE